MSIRIDHIAIATHDKYASARFYTEIFGLGNPEPVGSFLAVHLDASSTLHFADIEFEFPGQHYAFHVGDGEFDAIRARLDERSIRYVPGPRGGEPGTINHNHGGRGLYFDDPGGHHLEILTRRYGSGNW